MDPPVPVILGLPDLLPPPEGNDENIFSELSEGSETLPFIRGIFQGILSEVLGVVDTIPPSDGGNMGLEIKLVVPLDQGSVVRIHPSYTKNRV